MKNLLLLVCLMSTACLHAQLVTVNGTWQYPSASLFTGRAEIQLTKAASNTCVTPAQVVPAFVVQASVTAGTMAATQLYPSYCLSLGPSSPATKVVLSGAGSGATVLISGSTTGSLSVTPGTGTIANASIVKIGLTVPDQLVCYMKATNANAIAANATLTQTTVTRTKPTQVGRYLTLGSRTALAPLLYGWSYYCVLPYNVTVYNNANIQMFTAQWVVPPGGGDVTTVDFTQLGAVK